jgi:RES domain-containing protein
LMTPAARRDRLRGCSGPDDGTGEERTFGCMGATALADGDRPAPWSVYDRSARGIAILVPSFAPGAEIEDRNLVL